jgi:hypothetical protein
MAYLESSHKLFIAATFSSTSAIASTQIDALPTLNSGILDVYTDRALLFFYTLITSHLFQARMPYFRLNECIGKVKF